MKITKLTVKQRTSIALAHSRINIWEGAVRSSKTISSIIRWIQFIREAEPGNLLMIGKTERTLKRNIIDVIIRILGRKRARYVAGAGEFHVLGRIVYVCGANDEAAQEKIRGLTLMGAYGDEVSTWPESFWVMLLSRLSMKGAKFFGTTNPDNPTHWLKKQLDRAAIWLKHDGSMGKLRRVGERTLKGKVMNLSRFSFIITDNITLPRKYIRDLMNEYTGLWYRRFIGGEWVAAEGAIFDFWDPDTMVVRDLPPIVRILGDGIDYGTTNPTAGVRVGVGQDGRLYAMAEWAPAHGTVGEHSKGYKRWLQDNTNPGYVVVDPAAAAFKLQLRTEGVSRVKNGNNDVLEGIRMVSSLISTGRLLIHESCVHLLDEIPGYSWDPKATEKGLDKPIKENDHFCDALRYIVFTTRVLWRPYLKEAGHGYASSQERMAA